MHRAYLELELQGLTEGRTGSGTFIRQTLSEVSRQQTKLLGQLELWLKRAREAGLQVEAIEALIAEAMHAMKEEELL